MKRVFGDFETNGLFEKAKTIRTTSGKVLTIPDFIPSPQSFSYIVTEGDLTNIQEAGVLYFYNPAIIDHRDEAEAIHGMSREFLSQYKDDFVGNTRKLYKLLFRANIVGHNFKGFDVRIAREFFNQIGYCMELPINDIEDTMFGTASYFGEVYSKREGKNIKSKRLKLGVLCKELNISDRLISATHRRVFGYEPKQNWHSASWDTVATYLCYRIAKSKNIMI